MPVSKENLDQFVLETVFNDNGTVEHFQILEKEQKKVMQNMDKMKSKTVKFNAEEKKFVSTTNHLSKAIKGLFAVFAVKKMIDYTEQWTNIRKTIATVTDNEERRKQIEDGIYKTALETHQSLEQTSKLYKGLYTASRSLNLSDEQTLQILKNINKTLAIGGGTIEENEATVQRLMRALASGELKPRAIFSLIDTAPQLARMIADGFGVSIEQLRKMSEQGKLTSKKVFESILSQTTKIDNEFKKTGITLKEAFTNLSTALSKVISDDASGAFFLLAKAMNLLAKNTWALQTAFVSLALIKGGKLIYTLAVMRQRFLSVRAPVNTLKNALQMIVSGDTIAGFSALVKKTVAFATASWAAVAPWLLLATVIASLLIVIDQIISIISGRESVAKQMVFGLGDLMTGQNKSATLGKTWLGTGGQAVTPSINNSSSSSRTDIKNEFTFNINGSQSPRATGREIERILSNRLRQAGAV